MNILKIIAKYAKTSLFFLFFNRLKIKSNYKFLTSLTSFNISTHEEWQITIIRDIILIVFIISFDTNFVDLLILFISSKRSVWLINIKNSSLEFKMIFKIFLTQFRNERFRFASVYCLKFVYERQIVTFLYTIEFSVIIPNPVNIYKKLHFIQ